MKSRIGDLEQEVANLDKLQAKMEKTLEGMIVYSKMNEVAQEKNHHLVEEAKDILDTVYSEKIKKNKGVFA
jgi:hypothetical protein